MGIKKYAVQQTGTLELRDANDELMIGDDGQRMVVTLYGPGSREYARAQAAQSNRMIDKLKKKGKTEQSAEEKAREQAEFLADCTHSFSDNIGTDYPGLEGRALFLAMYQDQEIGFAAEQVGKHLGDWANFYKGSPKP